MNRSLIIQVIIFTSLIMMMGTISSKKEPKETEEENSKLREKVSIEEVTNIESES